jgi:hypothetical protein
MYGGRGPGRGRCSTQQLRGNELDAPEPWTAAFSERQLLPDPLSAHQPARC